jgi:large subunit ribosomal protein L14
MLYIGNNSKISVIDNSGVSKIKNIIIYRGEIGTAGNLGIGSVAQVRPRRKLKKGDLIKTILIQTRKAVYRSMGSYIRSVSSRAILIKKQEFEPLANRLNGFFFIELRRYQEFRSTSLTVYIILLINAIL